MREVRKDRLENIKGKAGGIKSMREARNKRVRTLVKVKTSAGKKVKIAQSWRARIGNASGKNQGKVERRRSCAEIG